LLCYRADRPADLAARQAAAWQKWLDWAQLHLDARLTVTVGVLPVRQDDEALAALRRSVEGLEDWRLVGLHAATTLTGSIVLGLALSRGALGTEEAFASSVLDELYEIELWGAEEEQTRRHQRLRRDLAAVEAFFAALD
jgi:chaperone required for assembly of F1-ATPase